MNASFMSSSSSSSVTSFLLLLLHLAAADRFASGLVRGVGAVRGDADHDGGGAEGRHSHAATGQGPVNALGNTQLTHRLSGFHLGGRHHGRYSVV